MTNFDYSLPMILRRTLEAVMPRYREICAAFDLTDQQWRILRVLWEEGRATSARLSERTLLPPPSLVGILDRLEKKGLVARARSDTDRRMVHVFLTPLGTSLRQRVLPGIAALNDEIFDIVDPSDWETTVRTLDAIAETVKAQTDKDARRTA